MNEKTNSFRSNARLFQEWATVAMSQSQEYAKIDRELDSILLLADRVLSAFQDDINFRRVWDIATCLDAIADAERDQLFKLAEELLENMELWFKAILWLVDPVAWGKYTSTSQAERHFTLSPLIETLGLLNSQELALGKEDYLQISDPARQLILLAYRYRNPLIHSPKDYPETNKVIFPQAAFTSLLAPIYKHSVALRKRLHVLIASPLVSSDTINLLALVNHERLNHLSRFRVRERWITELGSRLKQKSQSSLPYLLLVGYEGIGKSALCAKLSELLSSVPEDLGRHAGSVRKIAPWLPNIVLHFGKQSNQADEIVRSLIAQANTLLLEPYQLPSIGEYSAADIFVDIISSNQFQAMPITTRVGQAAATDTRLSQPVLQPPNLRRQIHVPDSLRFRRTIYQVFDRVVQERGELIVIIDAVDEISPDGRSLDFLPESLPKGVTALLTARNNTEAERWLTAHRDTENIRLKGLDRAEVSALTDIPNDNEDGRSFNDRLWQISQGWPLLILAAKKKREMHHGALATLQIDRSADPIFERQAGEWKDITIITNDGRASGEMLLLLAVFEPALPLDLDHIQSYLAFRSLQFTQAEIRQLLYQMGAQVEGLEAGKVKLSLRSFADYIRTQYYSHSDLHNNLKKIVEWLSSQSEIDAKLIATFLQYWLDPIQTKNKGFQDVVSELVNSLIARKDADLLYNIYQLSKEKRERGKLLGFAEKCLRVAAEQGNLDAMEALGSRLIDGIDLLPNTEEGVSWLQKANDAGSISAMRKLGNRFLDGDGLPKNTKDGLFWLGRAAETGDPKAIVALAMRYLIGDMIPQDIETGEYLLRKLVDRDDPIGIRTYSHLLLTGFILPPNPDEAERMLRDLAERGDPKAMTQLGSLLFGYFGEKQNIEEAKKWLYRAIEAGDDEAQLTLGRYLLSSLDPQDKAEGLRVLRNTAETNNKDALFDLGIRFLTGMTVEQNTQEGEILLMEAAELGDTKSMAYLGYLLIESQYLKKDLKRGEDWLRKSVDLGNSDGMAFLGQFLLGGQHFKQNIDEGEKLLRRSILDSNINAMTIFGGILVAGIILPKNMDEGMELLRKASVFGHPLANVILGQLLLKNQDRTIQKKGEQMLYFAANLGSPEAMVMLSEQLIEGTGLEKNVPEGEDWLRKATQGNNVNAMTILGTRLVDGLGLKKNIDEGIEWLVKAAESGSTNAMRVLGVRLLDGQLTGSQTGEDWLIKACQLGDTQAMTIMGERLLDGNGLARDIKQGEKWLRNAGYRRDVQAMYILSSRYQQGRGLAKNPKEAELWNKKMLSTNNGSTFYMNGMKHYKVGDLRLAAEAFLQAFQLGIYLAGNNLAYMARRLEISSDMIVPPVGELLAKCLDNKEEVGYINYALCLASGYQFAVDWEKADQIISSQRTNRYAEAVLGWWYEQLAVKNDPEGHLVVGWLVRHHIAKDPDNISIHQRMDLARQGGWNVPAWMDEPTP
jgi:TPR repeat protein